MWLALDVDLNWCLTPWTELRLLASLSRGLRVCLSFTGAALLIEVCSECILVIVFAREVVGKSLLFVSCQNSSQ